MSRRDEILKLRKQGMTLQGIGLKYGITKERVRQIIKPPSRAPRQGFKVMLTISEAAQLLGLHINTFRRWANKGLFPTYRLGTRRDRRFRRADIEHFLKQSRQ
jgi:excisionase family DNA binding protein